MRSTCVPRSPPCRGPRFAVETALPGALATRQLGDFAAVVVSDAGLLSGVAANALTKYVQGGGAALLTLGTRAAQLDTIPVSGAKRARGDARRQADEPAHIGDMEQSHPVLREAGCLAGRCVSCATSRPRRPKARAC